MKTIEQLRIDDLTKALKWIRQTLDVSIAIGEREAMSMASERAILLIDEVLRSDEV